MRTKASVLYSSAMAILLVSGVLIWKKPVIFSFGPSSNASGKPFVCVLNPFRDKSPEAFIDTLFKKLQNPSPSIILGLFPNEKEPDFPDFLIKNITENPIQSWRLSCIVKDQNGSFNYAYSVWRRGHTEPIDVWITLKRDAAGFQITNFEYGIR